VALSDFLLLLASINFSRRYWDLCERFPSKSITSASAGRKDDIVAAFTSMGITPRYDSRGPSFTFEEEKIGGFLWVSTFVKQGRSAELIFFGKYNGSTIGSNFAVMAYDSKRFADPSFQLDRFNGPPRYPRPVHNGDRLAICEIVKEHVLLTREIKGAIRRRDAENPFSCPV
jgi:hypothetical protein